MNRRVDEELTQHRLRLRDMKQRFLPPGIYGNSAIAWFIQTADGWRPLGPAHRPPGPSFGDTITDWSYVSADRKR